MKRNTAQSSRKRSWSFILIAVLAILCVISVAVAAAAILYAQRQTGREDYSNHEGATMDSHSQPSKTTTVDTTTAPEESPVTASVSDAEIQTIIEEADFIAAGYDYEQAISMLESSEFFAQSSVMQDRVAQYQELDRQLVVYDKPDSITHIFFHSLIVDTARAFDGDEDQNGYNMYMTTVDEFNKILEQMYQRGYVLISPYDMAYEVTDETGTYFKYGEIRLPEGKTPFLMSQDDLNYYSYMVGTGSGINETPIFADTHGDGFAHRIVIGDDGFPTCEYMDADGNITTGDYDLVPVLENFIQKHPDFSYHGARAILGVTGYEGVFGYRTKPSYEAALGSEAYAAEVQAAKDVAQCLREHGWILASHSYGHPAYGNISAERIEKDSTKWENTVQTIIGETDILLYPHGSDIAGVEKYSFENNKFSVLYEDGYRYFFNVDGRTWNQLGSNYFRGGRRNLDGYRIYHNPDMVSDLFDANTVLDQSRPLPVPSVGGGM